MDLGLAGKVAVVTGASKGIGLAVCQSLVAEGARVVAGARHASAELEELAAGGAVQAVAVDLSTPEGPAELVAQAGHQLDILVNNIGSAPPRLEGFLTISDADWQATLNLDLMAAIRACRAALPVMVAAGHGSIVSVCSVNATLADPIVMDYSAAKAALANFSKSLSKEFGPKGIRVNTVSPGPVATDLWLGDHGMAASISAATGGKPADIASSAVAGAATGRFTQPAEVASMVVVLASDRAGNVTGADLIMDGGLRPTW